MLQAPGSIAERWDVVLASQSNGAQHRALAAALGLCWPRFRRRHPYTNNALTYGGHVLDTLLGEGAQLGEILAAGREALELCVSGLVEVEGERTFSETPAAGATTGG